MNDIPGFADPSLLKDSAKNEEGKKKGNKKGGFQSMHLNYNVLKGIMKRGYKQPTPIQRKVSTYYRYVFALFDLLFLDNSYNIGWKRCSGHGKNR